MGNQLRDTIRNTVLELLKSGTSEANIQKLTRRHQGKVHFIPIRFRIVGGILQGLNIKFGKFIETLIRNIVEIDAGISAMKDSGKNSLQPETIHTCFNVQFLLFEQQADM